MWSLGVILIELFWLNIFFCFFFGFLDINECVLDVLFVKYVYYVNDCYDDFNCINIKGLFYCICFNGYFGNGVNCVGK